MITDQISLAFITTKIITRHAESTRRLINISIKENMRIIQLKKSRFTCGIVGKSLIMPKTIPTRKFNMISTIKKAPPLPYVFIIDVILR